MTRLACIRESAEGTFCGRFLRPDGEGVYISHPGCFPPSPAKTRVCIPSFSPTAHRLLAWPSPSPPRLLLVWDLLRLLTPQFAQLVAKTTTWSAFHLDNAASFDEPMMLFNHHHHLVRISPSLQKGNLEPTAASSFPPRPEPWHSPVGFRSPQLWNFWNFTEAEMVPSAACGDHLLSLGVMSSPFMHGVAHVKTSSPLYG